MLNFYGINVRASERGKTDGPVGHPKAAGERHTISVGFETSG